MKVFWWTAKAPGVEDGHPVPRATFTSKIVSNTETSDVTMVLDEGSVEDLQQHRRQVRTACQ